MSRALVVEDDPVIRTLLGKLLAREGYEVDSYEDGESAWIAYQRDEHHLVFLDWILPGKDGGDLCRQIRGHAGGASTVIVVITSRDEAGALGEVLEAGADDYLPKPIDRAMLRIRLSIAQREVEHLLRRRAAESELQAAWGQLEQSHDDLTSILNELRVGSVLTDEKGQLSFLSESACGLLGVDSHSAAGRWQDVFPFESKEIVRVEVMSKQQERERSKISAVAILDDRTRNWLEIEICDDPRNPRRKIFFLYDVSQVHALRRELGQEAHYQDLIGKSRPMRQVYQFIRDFAEVDTTVLITGETGTGKELVARAIHNASHRAAKLFVPVNCAGLTESLVASQLFGHKRGAFTGALQDQQGLFEAAQGGTLFLDEVGDLPSSVQTSLLRVLENREITRLGETQPRPVDVRVLSATNRDLTDCVSRGEFRQDLLYRIKIAHLEIPPLRDRREDIALLGDWFLRQLGTTLGRTVERISDETVRVLTSYNWPGNVRQLRNAIEVAIVRSRGDQLELGDLPPEVLKQSEQPRELLGETPADEREVIRAALERSRGNRSRAARLLGISRATLYRRLAQLDIND